MQCCCVPLDAWVCLQLPASQTSLPSHCMLSAANGNPACCHADAMHRPWHARRLPGPSRSRCGDGTFIP
jgi:hypothetical protein